MKTTFLLSAFIAGIVGIALAGNQVEWTFTNVPYTQAGVAPSMTVKRNGVEIGLIRVEKVFTIQETQIEPGSTIEKNYRWDDLVRKSIILQGSFLQSGLLVRYGCQEDGTLNVQMRNDTTETITVAGEFTVVRLNEVTQ